MNPNLLLSSSDRTAYPLRILEVLLAKGEHFDGSKIILTYSDRFGHLQLMQTGISGRIAELFVSVGDVLSVPNSRLASYFPIEDTNATLNNNPNNLMRFNSGKTSYPVSLLKLLLKPGDFFEKGEQIATISMNGSPELSLRADDSGKIVKWHVKVNQVLTSDGHCIVEYSACRRGSNVFQVLPVANHYRFDLPKEYFPLEIMKLPLRSGGRFEQGTVLAQVKTNLNSKCVISAAAPGALVRYYASKGDRIEWPHAILLECVSQRKTENRTPSTSPDYETLRVRQHKFLELDKDLYPVRITNLQVRPGDELKVGQPLFWILSKKGRYLEYLADAPIRIVKICKRQGELLTDGNQPVFEYVPTVFDQEPDHKTSTNNEKLRAHCTGKSSQKASQYLRRRNKASRENRSEFNWPHTAFGDLHKEKIKKSATFLVFAIGIVFLTITTIYSNKESGNIQSDIDYILKHSKPGQTSPTTEQQLSFESWISD